MLNANPDRGARRRCSHCGSPFYDMLRTPIVCPKCGTKYAPIIASRRARATPTGTDPEPVVEQARAADVDETEEKDDAEDDEAEEADGDDLIDEASEDDDGAEPAETGGRSEKA